MAVDLATPRPSTSDVHEARSRQQLGPLTRLASWNAGASLLNYGVRIGTRLLVTPVLVSGLGQTLFGVWEILGRLVSYTSAEGQPTHALRLVIAQKQAESEHKSKRRVVGAALVIWAFAIPLLIGLGVLVAWLAPSLTQTPDAFYTEVRVTCGLLIATFLISALTSVPQSALYGMNLGYRRMGWQAGISIVGGAGAAGAVALGFGLPGLGVACVLTAVAAALCYFALVRHYLPWFGPSRPARAELRSLFGMTAWLSTGNIIAKVALASDVVILGAIAAPAVVTTYVLTGYAARTAIGVHVFATSAAVPGLGGVLGSRQFARAARARAELLLLTWLFATTVGVNVLLWNHSFLGLWVGGENYAGIWIDVLIVLIATQTAFIRVDAYIIDAMLRPRVRVTVAAIAAAATVITAIVLTWRFGLIGLCCGILLGRTVQSVAYPLLVRARLADAARSFHVSPVRLIATSALLLTVAGFIGQRTATTSWLEWLAGVTASVLISVAAAFVLGPTVEARHALTSRIRAIVSRRGQS